MCALRGDTCSFFILSCNILFRWHRITRRDWREVNTFPGFLTGVGCWRMTVGGTDFLIYLFCEQANAIQLLKDIGLLRRTMQCNTCNTAISVHRVTRIRPSTTASSLLNLGLGHTQTPFRARGVALSSSWANRTAGKTMSSIWHTTCSRRGRFPLQVCSTTTHTRDHPQVRLKFGYFLTTYFPTYTPTTHHPHVAVHVISILTTSFPAPTSHFHSFSAKQTSKYTPSPARNRRLLLPHFSDVIVTETTQSRMAHSLRAILDPPFSSTSIFNIIHYYYI